MHPNAQLIQQFYQAFQQLDADAMAACYAPEVSFSDPVFPRLQGQAAANMWRMLTRRAKNFSLQFEQVEADDHCGSARWVATYEFTQTGRTVVNHIVAHFEFADGKIILHRDHFDFWKWARQALGLSGVLLGWSAFLQNKVRQQAANNLAKFSASLNK